MICNFTGKTSYESAALAFVSLPAKKRKGMSAFRCSACGQYHFTSKPQIPGHKAAQIRRRVAAMKIR
ncbi:hypothetical protein UFOVP119_7 [uncultured Caudovirales phage]|uniref:Uncharacterized protein n=1 Tax=uncultured Caudovirales phage TaxID=2100421 RepID=A0A6J5LAR8_9CAUD|nr:hypothetical protein UFOVP119_7 [uncultured Caudovirales phage]